MNNEVEVIDALSFEIEDEWKRVDELLAMPGAASWGMAVVEGRKIFRQVLKEVSFGETIDEEIHNARELFDNLGKILEADRISQKVINEVGYRVTKAEAKKSCGALIQGILDMIGRDFEPKGFSQKLANNLNFFWGHHPKLLSGFLGGLIVVIVAVWFLADTDIGQWIVNLAVGFSRFVMSWTLLLGLLIAAFLVALGISFAYFERRKRG